MMISNAYHSFRDLNLSVFVFFAERLPGMVRDNQYFYTGSIFYALVKKAIKFCVISWKFTGKANLINAPHF